MPLDPWRASAQSLRATCDSGTVSFTPFNQGAGTSQGVSPIFQTYEQLLWLWFDMLCEFIRLMLFAPVIEA